MKTKLFLSIALLLQTALLLHSKHESLQWRQAAYKWGNAFTNMEIQCIEAQSIARDSQKVAWEVLNRNHP